MGPVRVGIEQEWHTYAAADPSRHLQPDEVLAAVTAGGPLPWGSTVTVEPGGQVELATLAAAPWWQALEALADDGRALRTALAEAGIVTLAAGTDPFRAPVRTLRKPRYDAMEAYFDAWGPAGRMMMSGCASIQVNIDHGSPATMARRWALGHHIGPALAAAFACSPSSTHRSARLAVWAQLDPTRTGPALHTGDLATDWAAYVLDARLMFRHDEDERCSLVASPVTFGDWVDGALPGRRPTFADLAYHCTTLFPPVRPRGWLELRWLDSLPAGLAETAVATVVAVLVDDDAGNQAALACAPVADAWARAAGRGAGDPALAAAGVAVLHAAASALGRAGAPPAVAEAVLDAAERWPARGRCPGDDLDDRLRAGATAATLALREQEAPAWR